MLPIHRSLTLLALTLLIASGLASPRPASAADEAVSVKVADAVTYVKLVEIKLSIGKMTREGAKLRGSYFINVPLVKSKSEAGEIVLPLAKDVAEYAREGGSLSGTGFAKGTEIKNPSRKIKARFGPYDEATGQGDIEMTIDTGARILRFTSTYHLGADGLVAMR